MTFSNVNELKECIERTDLFEVYFNPEYQVLTDCIVSLAIEGNTLLITYNNNEALDIISKTKYKVDKSIIHNHINDKNIKISLANRIGEIIYNFYLFNCKLKTIANTILSYTDNTYQSILIIEFESIYKEE